MKLRLALVTLLATASLALAAGKPVQLILSSKQLEPTTTFEIRFAEAMIAADQVGQQAETPPVVFRPAVKGRFTWLSERSGVFAPEEALPLGTTLLLGLAPDLVKADGKPLEAEFRETVQTPPMQMKGWNARDAGWQEDATARPAFSLLFNVNVDPVAAVRFCKFVDKAGDEVAAQVARANADEQYFPTWKSGDRTLYTWAERFAAKPNATGLEAGPRDNLVLVSPMQPLPAGEDWKLIVAAGLPAREGGFTLIDRVEIPIGTVQSAEATNFINNKRRVEMTFTKPLAKEITAANRARWIRLDPQPKNFAATVNGARVEFTGEFLLETPYRVEVDAGLPSAQPFVLAGRFEKKLEFQQVPARLYFEDFNTHQLTTGRRKFHLLAINVPRLKVSAKLFPNDTVALALAAYQTYLRSNGDDFAKVDPDSIPGQVIWQRELDGTTAIDEQQPLTLDWNEILGAKQNGVVLLTAEQTGDGKRPGAQSLVQVTDLGLVWKRSPEECFVHVFSLASANPVAGAKVQAVNKTGAVLAEAQMDESGIARLPQLPADAWLFAESAGDRHLVDLGSGDGELNPSRLHVRFDDEEDDTVRDRPTFLFSERPVYQPGETLHLKGIARDWRNGHTRISAGAEVRLTAHDSRNRTFFNKTAKLSDAGAISEDIQLPVGVLGTFGVNLSYVGEKADAEPAATHEFEVQEYRPNAFEISIGRPKSALGETVLELPVTAKYYMGKPLSSAQLNWSIEAGDEGFLPEGFGEFAFCNNIANYRLERLLNRAGHFAQQGKADLDADGVATIAATIPINAKAPQPRTARVLCEITDLDQQTVSESGSVTIHPSDFYLGVRRPKSVVREGETIPAEMIAIRPDGSPMREPVSATLRLTRIDWQTNRIEGAGHSDEYRSEPRFVLSASTTTNTRTFSMKDGKWIANGDAPTTTSLIAGKPGEYLLEAVAKDAGGRDVLTTINLHVYGPTETMWESANGPIR